MVIALLLLLAGLSIGYLGFKWWLRYFLSIHWLHFPSHQALQKQSDNPLVKAERSLRKSAFAEVNMQRTPTFYTDEDLDEAFSFIVMLNRKTKTPLLSSRSYTHQALIRQQLAPHESSDYLTLHLLPNENYVFLDRLSGNSNDPIYTKRRQRIFMNYYIQILNQYPDHHIILMARSSPDERLLTKYLRLGFHVVGKQKHNQVDHWVLLLTKQNRLHPLSQNVKQYVLFQLFT